MFTKPRLLFSLLIGSLIWVSLIGDCGVEAVKQPCKTCKEFVVSFEKRFKETEKSNYAGGDTSWEEEKLGSYANSEVRLVEILDGVCRHSDYDCHRILENNEEHLEIWWFKLRRKEGKSDLKQWLCFSHLDVCCPNSTFGPSCEECPGGVANPCSGHGSCEGSEEKDGSGKCSCRRGYEGDTCQLCTKGYFNDTDEETFTCEACDKACKDSCSGSGPDMCDECAKGYDLSEEDETCKDIDECKDEDICKEGTYCLNLQGSHKCNTCDKACLKICNGPGPAKCAECEKGYTRDRAGICKDDDECEDPSTCKVGTYCENQPGTFICKACHISCKLECLGPGAGGCVECRDGYSMDNETCTDVDECSEESSPCDSETEVCQNLMGSYVCKCQEGLVKSTDGRCISEEELPPEVKPKKPKKKKKSKKGGKTKKSSKKKERGEDVVREDGEPAAPESPTTEQNLESGPETDVHTATAQGPDTTTPQVDEQNSESRMEVDSASLESNSLPIPEQTSESGSEEIVTDSVPVKRQNNLTQSAETQVDTDESSEPIDLGADSTTSNQEQTGKENNDVGGQTSEPDSRSEGATSEQEAAANVSTQESREEVAGQLNDRERVLNNVKATRQSQEKSEESHDEL